MYLFNHPYTQKITYIHAQTYRHMYRHTYTHKEDLLE